MWKERVTLAASLLFGIERSHPSHTVSYGIDTETMRILHQPDIVPLKNESLATVVPKKTNT